MKKLARVKGEEEEGGRKDAGPVARREYADFAGFAAPLASIRSLIAVSPFRTRLLAFCFVKCLHMALRKDARRLSRFV